MSLTLWALFAATVLAATVSPGPNVLIVITHALRHGWREAAFTVLGNVACLFLVALLAALGVGALIKAEPLAYTILKTAGALYLIYLGVKMLRASLTRSGGVDLPDAAPETARPHRLTLAGEAFLVSASNPKSVLFLSAVFPQFLTPETALAPQFAVMFATIIVMVGSVHMGYAVAASRLRARLAGPRAKAWMARVTGVTFLGLGAGVLVSK